ncbi:MAG: helix-turn-helix transcriptional regulator [Clostridia bacterium]|nr:helix-turn-helix transcriptional regulator [Clostridia bacterium]
MENISKIVGENIKIARKAKGLTQSQVAQTLYMTQQQYSRFENGIYELNYSQIIAICKLLDTTPNELFDYE